MGFYEDWIAEETALFPPKKENKTAQNGNGAQTQTKPSAQDNPAGKSSSGGVRNFWDITPRKQEKETMWSGGNTDRWRAQEYEDFRTAFSGEDKGEEKKFSINENFGAPKTPSVQDVINRAFGIKDPSMDMKYVDGKWIEMPKTLFGEEGAMIREAPGLNVDVGKTDDSTRQTIRKYAGQGMDDFYSKSSGVAKEDNTGGIDFGDNLTEEQILRFSLEDQTTDDIKSPYGEGVASLLSQWKKQMMKDHDMKTRVKVDPVIQGLQLLESKVMPEYFPAPQIQTFNVNGKTVWMDIANEPGIGFLSDGQLVIGNTNKEKYINDYLKWRDKRYSSIEEEKKVGEKDYSIIDVTDWLNQFMDKRAEQFKDAVKLPELQKYLLFEDKVKAQSSGDLKLYPEIRKHELFIYDGEIMNRDALGNIAFGHLGKQFGIPDDILTAAAGYAQIRANTSDLLWGVTAFDDPRDARRVRQGIARWERQQK